MDDEELDAGIGEIDDKIENCDSGDSKALSKLERSKELLIQRKGILQIKKDMLS